MNYTIGDFIKTPEYGGIRLIAGEENMGNVITRVNIMDNPDSFDWLISGELVITTGYIFQDDENLQREIIQKLSQINCAGLCLKIQRYFDAIPPCMIEEAQKLQFPLIELPFGHSLSSIINIVNNMIYTQRDTILEEALVVHRTLTNAALNSKGLDQITKIAVNNIHNAILFLDNKWRLLDFQDHPGNPFPLEDSLDMKIGGLPFPPDFTIAMPEKINIFKKPIARIYPMGNKNILCRILPIAAQDEVFGYIVVWETVRSLTEIDYIVLEQAAIIAAIDIVRKKEIEEERLRLQSDFFDSLLNDEIKSQSALFSLAQQNGLRFDRKYICLVLRPQQDFYGDENEKVISIDEAAMTSIANSASQKHGLYCISIIRSFRTVLLVETNKSDYTEIRETVEDFVEEMLISIGKLAPKLRLTVTVGPTAKDISEIPKSYAAAQQSFAYTQIICKENQLIFADDYAAHKLLSDNINKQTLLDFCKKSIHPLIEHDQQKGTSLVGTLENFFLYQGNVSKAAKKMFIHRNTYIYRIEKIKSLLNDDFTSSRKLLEYQIAIIALKTIENMLEPDGALLP